MTDQTANIPLLRKAVEWAEAEAAKPHPDREWDQGYWVMPASMDDPNACGLPFDGADDLARHRWRQGVSESCGTRFCIAGWIVHAAGEVVDYGDASARASELLGLDVWNTGALFDGENSIADVRRIAESLAGERL